MKNLLLTLIFIPFAAYSIQVIEVGPSRKDLKRNQCGEQLGKNLADTMNVYYANKALEDLLNSYEFNQAPLSQRISMLDKTLRGFGAEGQELFQRRVIIEQMRG